MPRPLTLSLLQSEAARFGRWQSGRPIRALFGATDGKAVGTHLEHQFQAKLERKYAYHRGNSARGIDFPALDVDIKVTSIRQPQSSCPFRSARQKIYGLGYSLIVFAYDKRDDAKARAARLDIKHVVFVDKTRTADFQTTSGLLRLIENKANRDDILAFFEERLLPFEGDETIALAEEVLRSPPVLGFLTVSKVSIQPAPFDQVLKLAGLEHGLWRLTPPRAKRRQPQA